MTTQPQDDIYANLDQVRLRANRLARASQKVLADMTAARPIDGRHFIPVELPDHCDEYRRARDSVLELITPNE
jgi:hypothetical protein